MASPWCWETLVNLYLAALKLQIGSQNSLYHCKTWSTSLAWSGHKLKLSYMSSLSVPAQISSIFVFTLPLVTWLMGPSNICIHEHLNLWKSSSKLSGSFHLGVMGGVMLARLKELYSFTIWTWSYHGGGVRDGNPPTTPWASLVSFTIERWPVSTSFSWLTSVWYEPLTSLLHGHHPSLWSN